jgi:hypothetical protein
LRAALREGGRAAGVTLFHALATAPAVAFTASPPNRCTARTELSPTDRTADPAPRVASVNPPSALATLAVMRLTLRARAGVARGFRDGGRRVGVERRGFVAGVLFLLDVALAFRFLVAMVTSRA